MTDIHTILLSELNRNLDSTELAKEIDDALIQRIHSAKQSYQAIPKANLRFDVEEKRFQLLNEISMLQSETFFKVGHNAMLSRMIPNILIPYLIDQGAAAYEARKEQDLSVLELNLHHFRGLLDQAVSGITKRRMARVFGIAGTILSIVLTGILVSYGAAMGLDKNWTLPILSIPVTVLLWSWIGSLAAMLYRFNRSSDTEMQYPLRWLFTRPLTGIVMGLVVYLLTKGALIVSGSEIPVQSLGSQEVVWLIAFFAGFSDRFSDFVLNAIVGRLGSTETGPSDHKPVRSQPSPAFAPTHRTFEMLDELAWSRRHGPRHVVAADDNAELADDGEGLEDLTPPANKDPKSTNGKQA